MAGRKTTLYDIHKELGARMVDFGGWDMPIQYTGVIDEHKAVREKCGLFDVSHMGEILVTGKDSANFLQFITINDVKNLTDGKGQYTAILNDEGGMIDDLILYRLEDDLFLICANASNIDKDFTWIKKQASSFDVQVTDESSKYSQIAIQGPLSTKAIEAVFDESENISRLPYTGIISISYGNHSVLLARTGYTGEKGYEIYLPNEAADSLWLDLLNSSEDVSPVGLGARDTLRLEACYLLYGNDMNESVSPLEAGIGWATKLDKGDFIGRDSLIKQKNQGVKRRVYAFILEDKGIARSGMDIYLGDEKIGHVTSGSVLPSLGANGGMALLDAHRVKVNDEVFVDVRGKRKLAKIMKRPLYSAKVKS